jgi:hypothetical protein
VTRPGDDPNAGSGYTGPPPTANHDPGLYPQPGGPYAYPYLPQPGYGPPPGYGYPAPGYGYPPPGDRRPGPLTAAAVLGYINAGLLILAAMILFSGASLISDLSDQDSTLDPGSITAELTFDGFLNLFAGGLLIAGAVLMSTRRAAGRTLYSAGGAIVLIEVIYWLVRWGDLVQNVSDLVPYVLLFTALAVIGLSLAWTAQGTRWLRVNPTPGGYYPK